MVEKSAGKYKKLLVGRGLLFLSSVVRFVKEIVLPPLADQQEKIPEDRKEDDPDDDDVRAEKIDALGSLVAHGLMQDAGAIGQSAETSVYTQR